MDGNGLFNFGTSNSYTKSVTEMADIVIVETNEGVPKCLGGHSENIHISEVDYIVEAEKSPMLAIPRPTASSEEIKMAELIMEEIHDGACLQLGIGGIPNTVGSLLVESDLKDLGMHSEMMCDASWTSTTPARSRDDISIPIEIKWSTPLPWGRRSSTSSSTTTPSVPPIPSIIPMRQTSSPETTT
jgi:hypothetical protein